MAQQVTTFDDLAAAIPAGRAFRKTLTQWTAHLANGIRVAVIFPYQDGFALANRHYGGYPLKFDTLDSAKNSAALRIPFIAEWREVEVPQ